MHAESGSGEIPHYSAFARTDSRVLQAVGRACDVRQAGEAAKRPDRSTSRQWFPSHLLRAAKDEDRKIGGRVLLLGVVSAKGAACRILGLAKSDGLRSASFPGPQHWRLT